LTKEGDTIRHFSIESGRIRWRVNNGQVTPHHVNWEAEVDPYYIRRNSYLVVLDEGELDCGKAANKANSFPPNGMP
jgi:hypothetical protein